MMRRTTLLVLLLVSVLVSALVLADSPHSPGYVNHVAETIRSQISGRVYTKGSYHYEMRRRVHNGLCRHRYPDLVVVPHSTDDVSRVVRVAREYQMEISVRSGGHSFLCNSIKDSGVHLDMRALNKVKLLSPYMAALGPGSTWKRVLSIIQPKHYTMIHGQCLSVGVGGYLTGGGINVVGTTERHGSGAQNIHKFTAVLANGEVAEVTRQNVTIWDPNTGHTHVHQDPKDLHVALGMAGSSFGIVTEFHTNIWPKPETLPAIAICYIESAYDLRKLERAMSDGRYHISFFLPYIFHRSYAFENLQYIFGIITLPRFLRFLSARRVDPIFVSIIDNRGIPETDRIQAFNFLKSFGLRLAKSDAPVANILPNMFDLDDYERVYLSKEEYKKRGFQAVVSANVMGLSSLHVLDRFALDHPVFGFKHKYSKASMRAGCDFCYFIVVSTSQPERPIFDIGDTGRYQIELTCTYDPYKSKTCPKVLRHIKEHYFDHGARAQGDTPTQYVNTPSCERTDDFGPKYYTASGYERLLRAKEYWDPDNVFHHCQSIGSTDQNCCPI